MSSGGVRVRTSPETPPVSTIQPRWSKRRVTERARCAALELDADHQSATAYVRNAAALEAVTQAIRPAGSDVARARCEAPVHERSQRGERRRACRRSAEVGRRVNRRSAVRAPRRSKHAAAPDAGADGQPASEALAEANEVRHDPHVDAREPGAASTEPRPDLVADEQRSRSHARVADGGQKPGRRNDAAAPAEDRLDEHGADVAGRQRTIHRRHGGLERRRVARNSTNRRDVRVELFGERLAEGRAQSASCRRPRATDRDSRPRTQEPPPAASPAPPS